MKRVAFTLIALLSFTVISVAQTWYLDINKAKSKAMESNTNIMIFFHGSDWCAPCIKLQHEVIDTEEFETWADENVILVDADFPRRKGNQLSKEQIEKNHALADKYNPQGRFPLIVILNKEGNVICTAGYEGMGPEEYVGYLESKM